MRKLLFLLPVILLLFNQRDNSVLLNAEQGIANADSVQIYPDTLKTGHLRLYSPAWSVARNSTTGSSVVLTTIIQSGLDSTASYDNYRGVITIPIPALTQKPDSLHIYLYGSTNGSVLDTLWNIYSASKMRAGGITTADYSNFDGWQDSTVGAYNGVKLANDWNSTSYTSKYNKFVLNSAGLDSAYVAQGDTLFLALINLKDYYNLLFDKRDSYVSFRSAVAAYRPASAAYAVLYYTASEVSDDNARGLIGGDISEGRKW